MTCTLSRALNCRLKLPAVYGQLAGANVRPFESYRLPAVYGQLAGANVRPFESHDSPGSMQLESSVLAGGCAPGPLLIEHFSEFTLNWMLKSTLICTLNSSSNERLLYVGLYVDLYSFVL